MTGNRPIEPYIESHRFLELASSTTARISPAADIEALPLRAFTLDQYWQRGGYSSSLYADTDAASLAWRDDYLRNRLPLLPADRRGVPIDPRRFWPTLARFNGEPEDVLQRRLQLDTVALTEALRCASSNGLISPLPFWLTGEKKRRPLIYLTDSGLWHRLFASLPENAPFDPRGDKLHNKAWEGFNIEALRSAAGGRATAFVWRRDTVGEIDLVLKWDSGEHWAVEISSSATKSAGQGFWIGVEAVSASRKIIVRPSGSAGRTTAGIEYLTLEDALLTVSEGP